MARPARRESRAFAAIIAGLGLTLAGANQALAQAPSPRVDVIPEPLSVTHAKGAPVVVSDGVPIIVPRGDHEALVAARELARLAFEARGLRLPVQVSDEAPDHGTAVRFSRRRQPGDEAYALTVGSGRVKIAASGGAGLFYGAVTLWQLLTPDGGRGPVTLSPVSIEDAPRFAWRGLLLDSARHYQTPAAIERMLDAMALHKLNLLHWHLTDDQAWRLQILKYPRLTDIGGWRTPAAGSPDAQAGPDGKPKPYGGIYTQDEVRRIVAYASARHITVVPEIEMPGHALSALLAYPALGAGAPPPAASQAKWGGFPYVYNVDEATFGVLEDVLDEVMALFPGRYIHIGGDEAQTERWQGSPEVQARMRALGVADAPALQNYFTHRIAAFLQAHGRRMVGWDEILQGGGLPDNAVVMSWHGVDGAAAAAAAGHDAVLAPAPVLYLDNRQGEGPGEPPGRGYLVTLHDVYGFDPAPAAMKPEARAHILGLQGNLWTEHIRTEAQLQAMAFPRAAAVAETGWSALERKDWPDFVRRLPAEFARYAATGVGADAAALEVRIDAAPAAGDGATVTVSTQTGLGEIRYTTDGQAPGPASPRYDRPFTTALPAHIRAEALLDGAVLSPIADARLDALSVRRRTSQQLKLCNDKLGLNLEGPGPAEGPRGRYLVNPVDACWIYPAAALDGVARASVAVARLPFIFGLDPAHNTVILHPPRTPVGELEIRQDSCISDPVAVASLPPPSPDGAPVIITVDLPQRIGSHDLCFTFTAQAIDPVLAIDWVQLIPGAGS